MRVYDFIFDGVEVLKKAGTRTHGTQDIASDEVVVKIAGAM